jgi:hypothetical protein
MATNALAMAGLVRTRQGMTRHSATGKRYGKQAAVWGSPRRRRAPPSLLFRAAAGRDTIPLNGAVHDCRRGKPHSATSCRDPGDTDRSGASPGRAPGGCPHDPRRRERPRQGRCDLGARSRPSILISTGSSGSLSSSTRGSTKSKAAKLKLQAAPPLPSWTMVARLRLRLHPGYKKQRAGYVRTKFARMISRQTRVGNTQPSEVS